MWYTENLCYGCPECVHCGRDRDIDVYECDDCGSIGYEPDFLVEYEGRAICRDCLCEIEESENE